MSGATKITLKSSDNVEFVLDASIAMEFGAVKNFFDEPNINAESVPLPNVSSKCLSRMIEYCKSHLNFRARDASESEVKTFDDEFVKALDNDSLKEIIVGANYLIVKDLLDTLNQATADRIKNKSVEYVRRFFGIENDYTPEEEAALMTKNAWAFEGVSDDN